MRHRDLIITLRLKPNYTRLGRLFPLWSVEGSLSKSCKHFLLGRYLLDKQNFNRRRLSFGVVIYGLALLGGLYLFIEMAKIAHQGGRFWFDEPLLRLFHSHQTPGLDVFFRIVTWFGSRFLLIPLSIVILIVLLRRRLYTQAWLLGLGFGGAIVLTIVLKLVIARHRPDLFPSLIAMPISFSFPSAHATQAMAFATSLGLILWRTNVRWRISGEIALVVLALLVGVSRVYLQVHDPSDVLGGFLLALVWVFGIHAWMKWRRWRRK
jgi:undecaprenyl-diphosphatase